MAGIIIISITISIIVKAQSEEMGPAPGRFELSKGMLEVKTTMIPGHGAGIRDPRLELLQVEVWLENKLPVNSLPRILQTD